VGVSDTRESGTFKTSFGASFMQEKGILSIQERLRTRATSIGLDENDLHVMGSDDNQPIEVLVDIPGFTASGSVPVVEQLLGEAESAGDVARLCQDRLVCKPR
jgi:hypothetical protein